MSQDLQLLFSVTYPIMTERELPAGTRAILAGGSGRAAGAYYTPHRLPLPGSGARSPGTFRLSRGNAMKHSNHQPTVLVVEDDELTRLDMTRLLAAEGYLVLTAASGHDALATLQTPLEPIDVVLLDVPLPDVGGVDLCLRLREMYPELSVVICSGEAEPQEVARLVELGAL